MASAAAAGAAEAAGTVDGAGLVGVVEGAKARPPTRWRGTPEMLPVLAQANVVDAGGAGFLLLLDAFLLVLDGRPLPEPSGIAAPDLSALSGGSASGPEGGSAGDAGETHAVGDLRYEVMYLLAAPDDSIEAFKDVWAGIGDSIVVVGGDGLWNCSHPHERHRRGRRGRRARRQARAHPGHGPRRAGRGGALGPRGRRFARARGPRGGRGPGADDGRRGRGSGDGIGRIFRSLGVHHQVVGGQTMNPATADLVKAVEAVPSDEVVILPNNKNIRPVAEQVDALCSKTVRVVATGSIVEGFAALLAYDPAADAESNVASMTESAARSSPPRSPGRCGDSLTDAGEVHEGDFIGISATASSPLPTTRCCAPGCC